MGGNVLLTCHHRVFVCFRGGARSDTDLLFYHRPVLLRMYLILTIIEEFFETGGSSALDFNSFYSNSFIMVGINSDKGSCLADRSPAFVPLPQRNDTFSRKSVHLGFMRTDSFNPIALKYGRLGAEHMRNKSSNSPNQRDTD